MDFLFDIKHAINPEYILTIFVLICTILSFTMKNKTTIFYIALFGCFLALSSFSMLKFHIETTALSLSFVSNAFTIVFRFLILLGAVISLLLSKKYVEGFGNSTGEYYVLILTATLGAMLLAGANDLIMIFIALETLSLSGYALAGFTKKDKLSNEAALKYLIIGGASSAILLYGFSFLYGITSSTNLYEISSYLSYYETNAVVILAALFIIGGLSFKLSAVPFHAWTPDVYQGAPIPVAAFLSVVSKLAGFAIIIRLLNIIAVDQSILQIAIFAISIITMTVGNLMAVNQTNIRRLMAYSSIAQAGYLLLGVGLFTTMGLSSVIFYLITYLFMNFGTWTAIEIFINHTGKDSISDFNGLIYKQPLLAASLTICLLSLAGIPITAGFFSKFYLFQAVLFAGFKYTWILLIALINTLISVFYYLKVIKAMITKSEDIIVLEPKIKPSKSLSMVLGICVVAVILIGILSSNYINLSQYSAGKININSYQNKT